MVSRPVGKGGKPVGLCQLTEPRCLSIAGPAQQAGGETFRVYGGHRDQQEQPIRRDGAGADGRGGRWEQEGLQTRNAYRSCESTGERPSGADPVNCGVPGADDAILWYSGSHFARCIKLVEGHHKLSWLRGPRQVRINRT